MVPPWAAIRSRVTQMCDLVDVDGDQARRDGNEQRKKGYGALDAGHACLGAPDASLVVDEDAVDLLMEQEHEVFRVHAVAVCLGHSTPLRLLELDLGAEDVSVCPRERCRRADQCARSGRGVADDRGGAVDLGEAEVEVAALEAERCAHRAARTGDRKGEGPVTRAESRSGPD